MASLRLTLFGGFEARDGTGREIPMPRAAAMLLLAYLAIDAGVAHSREKLASLLWSESDDARARAGLRQALSVLRRRLPRAPTTLLYVDRNTIRLDNDGVETDIALFERLSRSRDPAELERAAAAYRGTFLDGLSTGHEECEQWLFEQRERLRDLYLRLLDRLLAAHLAANALHAARDAAERILRHDPLREDAHRNLMEIEFRLGHRGSALRQYDRCRQVLADELGVEPDAETTELYARIRSNTLRPNGPAASSPAVASPPSEPPALAAECYALARGFHQRGMDRRSLRLARAMYDRAAKSDPLFARAFAGLAICELYLSFLDSGRPLAPAQAAVSHALELDPDLAEAHAANGLALFAMGRYAEAEEEFERAARLDPDCYEASFYSAKSAVCQGRHEQSIGLFERAAMLRPGDYRSLAMMGDELARLGRRDEFDFVARRSSERVAAELALHPGNADAWAFGSTILADLGDMDLAEEWAERAMIVGPDDHLVQYNAAQTLALVGKADMALALMERSLSYLSLSRLVAWWSLEDRIGIFKDHPRFHALKQRLASVPCPTRSPQPPG